MSDEIRVLFATDLHGSTEAFRKLLEAACDPRVAPDALVLGGDLSGKQLIPIARSSEQRLVHHGDRRVDLCDPEATRQFEAHLERVGAYAYESDSAEIEALLHDRERVEEILISQVAARLKKWSDMAADYLRGQSFSCLLTGGNDDHDGILDQIRSFGNPKFRLVEEQVVDLGKGYELLSFGHSNPTPWGTPRELSEPEIAARLGVLAEEVKDWEKCVLNVHVPPHNSGLLDVANGLTEEMYFDPKYYFEVPKVLLGSWGEPIRVHVGSTAVRELIEQFRPALALVGHIHEACGTHVIPEVPWTRRLYFPFVTSPKPSNRCTTIVNPGSVAEEGQLRAYLLCLRPGKLRWAARIAR